MHQFRAWYPPHRWCSRVAPRSGGLGQPSTALTPANAAPMLYVAPRMCRRHLQISQGQGTVPALSCLSNSNHGLMEKMASGPPRAKGDGWKWPVQSSWKSGTTRSTSEAQRGFASISREPPALTPARLPCNTPSWTCWATRGGRLSGVQWIHRYCVKCCLLAKRLPSSSKSAIPR